MDTWQLIETINCHPYLLINKSSSLRKKLIKVLFQSPKRIYKTDKTKLLKKCIQEGQSIT